MEKRVVLSKKPTGVTVIEGFPGFGLVGTISTGFLIDHLSCEKIGTYFFEDTSPTLALHDCEVVDPVGVYYNKKYNLVIIHAITSPVGIEWEAADIVLDVCKQLKAKELITIEGVGGGAGKDANAYFFTSHNALKKKFEKAKLTCLSEGIIVGVTSALMLKSKTPLSCVFAETKSNLPDSKASAKVVETLDKYLGLKVDYKPLLKQAEEFENKLKNLLDQAMKAKETAEQKQPVRYIG